jgi:citrate lyase beta subunit
MADTQGPASGLDLGGLTAELDQRLAEADAALAARYPGERPGRQPVHTVYVPADQLDARLVTRYGRTAQAIVIQNAPAFLDLIDEDDRLLELVLAKLDQQPVEDLRIDFEDGYGARPDDEEDGAVRGAASSLRDILGQERAPAFCGIRFKSLERPTRARGLRTLALFLEALADGGRLPDGFVVTLPKVTSVDQVEALVVAADRLEAALSLAVGTLRFEIQVETPQSVLGADGTALVARMIHAAAGRCTGLHYGTYDYSAACGIAAGHQSLAHPAADHAKAVMQAAAAGTGVRLSDGSTNRLPVGDADAVRAAWAEHLALVRRSLARGFYQGWDLHPGQLPTRYAATFGFYRSGFGPAADRLRDYVDRTGSTVLDEPATARALADFLLRGRDCGALDPDEVAGRTGLDEAALLGLARRTDREGAR